MTHYGAETDIAYPDINTKVETTATYAAGAIKTSFKRFTVRKKIHSTDEQTVEYNRFAALIEQKKKAGELLYRHSDASMLPTFVIEYPKVDYDGSYFVIITYTEVLL